MPNDVFEVKAVCGEFQRNALQKVVARLEVVRGHRCLDLRTFAPDGAGRFAATRQGLCMAIDKLPALHRLVHDLHDAAVAEGWLAEAADEGSAHEEPAREPALEPVIAEQAKERQRAAGGAVPQKSAEPPVETREEVAEIAGAGAPATGKESEV